MNRFNESTDLVRRKNHSHAAECFFLFNEWDFCEILTNMIQFCGLSCSFYPQTFVPYNPQETLLLLYMCNRVVYICLLWSTSLLESVKVKTTSMIYTLIYLPSDQMWGWRFSIKCQRLKTRLFILLLMRHVNFEVLEILRIQDRWNIW